MTTVIVRYHKISPYFLWRFISQELPVGFCSSKKQSFEHLLGLFIGVFESGFTAAESEQSQFVLNIFNSGFTYYFSCCLTSHYTSPSDQLLASHLFSFLYEILAGSVLFLLLLSLQPRPRRLNSHLHCCIEAPSPTRPSTKLQLCFVISLDWLIGFPSFLDHWKCNLKLFDLLNQTLPDCKSYKCIALFLNFVLDQVGVPPAPSCIFLVDISGNCKLTFQLGLSFVFQPSFVSLPALH